MWLQRVAVTKFRLLTEEEIAALKADLKREFPDIPYSVRKKKGKGVSVVPTKKADFRFTEDQVHRLYDFLRARGMTSMNIPREIPREQLIFHFTSGFNYWLVAHEEEAPTAPPPPEAPSSPSSPSRPAGLTGVAAEFANRIEDLLGAEEYDVAKAKALGAWITDTFRVELPRTPRGQKKLKERAQSLVWNLKSGGASRERDVRIIWEELAPQLGNLVRYFTDIGGTVIPKEVKTSQATYLNRVGLDEKKLKRYTDRLDALFASVKGWRRGAFKGGLVVSLSGPKTFRGTSGGVYKSGEDTLHVRATPKILKREAGSYGSIDYILVHELAHRYERQNHVPIDFERSEWWTTRYSRKEGESFAELFAMGNWPSVSQASLAVTPEELAIRLARFEQLM
jgi:hypothetical protein